MLKPLLGAACLVVCLASQRHYMRGLMAGAVN